MGRGSLLVVRPVRAGEGECGERGVCWRRDLSHAGEGAGRWESAGGETCPMRGRAGVGRGESAGEENCPMRGRAAWGKGSLLAMRPVHAGEGSLLTLRPVHAGEGGREESGVCWR